MFAVVRFIDDHDKRLHVIHVDDIDSFEPRDTSDYNNLSVYNAYWQDPVDDSNNGLYKTQVLMLAVAVQQDRPASQSMLPALPMSEDTESLVEAPCLSAAQPQKETMGEERPRNITHLGQIGNFIYMGDGSSHLMNGIIISGTCAKKKYLETKNQAWL
ncbi:uncharacterized protein LOC142802728 isoform X2 [Rhipicephalus microplus]|uniref:uncharacterized protein LOC142802728 isoform X2 n=1 Tax=Rhipicephalus microplus TaxID=6941 RepID=UPI003F6CEE20